MQGSITPFPANEILLGELAPDNLREHLESMATSTSMDSHYLVYLLARLELLMATDKAERSEFIKDNKVRGLLLALNDRTGWALTYGGLTQTTVDALKKIDPNISPCDFRPKRFAVMAVAKLPADHKPIPNTTAKTYSIPGKSSSDATHIQN